MNRSNAHSFDDVPARPPLMVWWIVWGATLLGLTGIYLALGRGPALLPPAGQHPLFGLIGMVPIFLSIVLRWLLLPRLANYFHGFVVFVVGVSLAESGGILGIFLGGAYRQSLVVLGLLSIAQYVPFYAKALLRPRAVGFIPNN